MPVEFNSGAEMAGWVERAITQAMEAQGWVGGCKVFFRGADCELYGFRDGEGVERIPSVVP